MCPATQRGDLSSAPQVTSGTLVGERERRVRDKRQNGRTQPFGKLESQWHFARTGPRGKNIPLGARILGIVCDFDRLEGTGLSAQVALDTMRGRQGRYDSKLLESFASTQGSHGRDAEVVEIPIRLVRVGMTFLQDVCTNAGALLVARGLDATPSLVERFCDFAPGSVREPVRVSLRRAPSPT
jgi:hypothetical protein